MNYKHIQKTAYELQKAIWYEKEKLLPNQQPTALELLKPELAAKILGLRYQTYQDLGNQKFSFKGQRYKVAGLIDRQQKVIGVLEDKPESMKFTGAHEIGHWLLHPNEIMHRDRPISSNYLNQEQKPQLEKEADYFAACFLMPPKLLKNCFMNSFCLNNMPFIFDEHTAFHLDPSDPCILLETSEDSLDRELALASCSSYAGRRFKSLSELFGVSTSAMAIRLKELKFIRWP
ncbi:ImmA/IrrE family metallo-endopeptidase [Methylophaga pinxianii]|uniref:ImmA/IrrE family metallo-endopeptidase n=1 Tax=Methylophaga pinxianii TaxID=2881052 RepID=UPI001CF22F96|nr:ImmA/IrrE family metallo-endopeptidase [Methylophaga pinxianii]MCB2427984.1 ImmA/IrrE family metallo-endopeptidase [Methylophaga pinxianii]UPH44474.1 ImmA/IrrE family metallo-endopeptidase [Methylophaga pinxianii]